jgi:hypothetical protein
MCSLPLCFAVTQAPCGDRRKTRRLQVSYALAQTRVRSYINSMQKWAIILPLVAFLGAAMWFAFHVWTTDAGPPMPASGYVAMTIGILFSLVVGIGLMALVFYSHRHGYDEGGQGRVGDRD